ncbi:AMIN domain-containing protein, partial [Campylobacter coli]|nr:AMIN domain-containing protein [Campylobacter coli]
MKKNRWILFFLFFGFAYANDNPFSGEQNVSIITPS